MPVTQHYCGEVDTGIHGSKQLGDPAPIKVGGEDRQTPELSSNCTYVYSQSHTGTHVLSTFVEHFPCILTICLHSGNFLVMLIHYFLSGSCSNSLKLRSDMCAPHHSLQIYQG